MNFNFNLFKQRFLGGVLQNVTAPAITGNTWEEGLLYVSNGEWKDRPDSFSYQWARDGVDIAGATNQTYTCVSADVGTNVTCLVTATNTSTSQSNSESSAAVSVVDNYATKVLSYSPIAYYRLNETSGSVADNHEGTAAKDAAYLGGVGGIGIDEALTLDGFPCIKKPTSTGAVNLYSATLAGEFDGNTGYFGIWLRSDDEKEWDEQPSSRRIYYAYVDNNNRFIFQHNSGGTYMFQRIAGGTSVNVQVDMSSNPQGWQFFLATWDVNAGASGELKFYLNGTQVDTTRTSIGTFTGSITSTGFMLGATNTSGSNLFQNFKWSDVMLGDSYLSDSNVTDLATRSTGKYWTINEVKEWDLDTIYSNDFGGLKFLYDVDNDGELELITTSEETGKVACLKQDDTELWNVTIKSGSPTLNSRVPQVREGVLYVALSFDTYAVRLSDGVVLWTRLGVSGKMTISNIGVVLASNTTVNCLKYSDGTDVTGFPYTTSFTQNANQTLAAGDIDDDGFDEIFVNSANGQFAVVDHDGTLLWEKTTGYTHSHVDWAHFADVDEDGNTELVIAVDTDSSAAGEGDEIAIFSAAGTLKDSYTAGSPQVQLRVIDSGDAKILYCTETDGKIGAVDENLDAVFSEFSGSVDGGQIAIADLEHSGIPQIIANGSESHPGSFRVFRGNNGELLRFFTSDSGREYTNLASGLGWYFPHDNSAPDQGQGKLGMPLTGKLGLLFTQSRDTGTYPLRILQLNLQDIP